MSFEEIVLCKEEFELLSRLTTGEPLTYKPFAIKAPYLYRLQKLGLIQSDFAKESGTIDVAEDDRIAHITQLGESYFYYLINKKHESRIQRVREGITLAIAFAALIVSIIALFRP